MSNYRVDVGGSMFVSNIDSGSVPVDISGTVTQTITSRDLRFGITPVSGSDKFTDIGIESDVGYHFYINGPTTLEAGKSTLVDLCIDQTGNVGIGKIPVKKLDINGNVFVENTLTADNTINTNNTSLIINGTLSCSTLRYGTSGNVYSTFPRGTVLMTTLTTGIAGWTDITESFYSKMISIKNGSSNNIYDDGGNDNVALTQHISHTHGNSVHNVSHNHTYNLGNNISYYSGAHSHTIGTKTTTSPGNHSHSYTDSYNYSFVGRNNTYTLIGRNATNTADVNANTGEAPNNHNHTVNDSNTSVETHTHSHGSAGDQGTEDTGGSHTHTANNSGSATPGSFSIVPLHYNVRIIRKN